MQLRRLSVAKIIISKAETHPIKFQSNSGMTNWCNQSLLSLHWRKSHRNAWQHRAQHGYARRGGLSDEALQAFRAVLPSHS